MVGVIAAAGTLLCGRAGESRFSGFRFCIKKFKNLKSGKVQNLGFLVFLNLHNFFRKNVSWSGFYVTLTKSAILLRYV